MKKLSLLFALLFSIVVVRAHKNHGQSILNLKLWNNSGFEVIIDNHESNGNTNFFSKKITPGYHTLRVVKTKINPHGHGAMKQVLYVGEINIPHNAKVIATVTPQRKLNMKIMKKGKKGHAGHHHGGYGQNNSCNDGYGDINYGHHGQSFNYVMNDDSFNQLLQLMNNSSFDSDKMSIAQQALNQNKLNTIQVVKLTSVFTFDSGKLEFAKLAYSNTIDKQNYFLVNNEFIFSSTAQDLNNYINSYG